MKLTQLFCVISLAFLSGCGLFRNWRDSVGEITEPPPTPSSVSTSQEALISQIDNLLLPNEDCLLPCFGSLYPHQSNTEAIEEFVNQFDADGSKVQIRPHETGGIGISLFFEPAGLFSINLLAEDEQLSSITVGISSVHEWFSETPYNLPDVFRTYGEPDSIFVLIAGPPTRFALVMPYNEQGFMFRYSATYADSQIINGEEPLSICLHPEIVDLNQIDIWLQSEDKIPLVENRQPDLHDEREIRPWWDIQRMANVTVTEFVDFFMSNPQQCFPIPSLAELREQGYVP